VILRFPLTTRAHVSYNRPVPLLTLVVLDTQVEAREEEFRCRYMYIIGNFMYVINIRLESTTLMHFAIFNTLSHSMC
jgi:hypothetical protein